MSFVLQCFFNLGSNFQTGEISEGIQRQNQQWNWTSIPGEGVGIFQFSGTDMLWDPLRVGTKEKHSGHCRKEKLYVHVEAERSRD